MQRIGYLDLPCGLSGEMLLACLVDCGWGEDRLLAVLGDFIPPTVRWVCSVEQVVKGSLRACGVSVLVDGRADFEIDAIVHAAVAGLKELGIEKLFVSVDFQKPWASRIVSEPVWDEAAMRVLAEMAVVDQPAMRLSRIGIGADPGDHPWPAVARLWVGEALSLTPASTR